MRITTSIDSVSATSMTTWRLCRQKWYWTYLRGIEPVSTKRYLTKGTIGHVAVLCALSGEDYRLAVVNETERLCGDNDLFDEEREELYTMADTIVQAVERFLLTPQPVRRNVSTEYEFRVRVPQLHGKYYAGRVDMISEDEQGQWWIDEFKFPARLRDQASIELSVQLPLYQLALRQSGIPVVGIRYVQIVPEVPAYPSINKNGTVSRAACKTDWATYQAAVIATGGDPAEYEEMREKLDKERFIDCFPLWRSDAHLAMFERELRGAVSDITAKHKQIYMADNPIVCSMCQFKDLCLETIRGRDPEELIETAYRPRGHYERKEEEDNGSF